MKLGDLICKDSVCFIETDGVDETIKILVEKACEKGWVKNRDIFEKAVLEREKLVSTGIGFGISIPHAKLTDIDNFFIVVGLSKKGLDWDAIDRKPVRAVFLIGGPEGQQTKYLKMISKLILLIKKEERRNEIFSAKNEQEFIELFEKF